ncbi:MAG: hypothetical protein U0R17_03310 [Acidimicrobiia bacterium]
MSSIHLDHGGQSDGHVEGVVPGASQAEIFRKHQQELIAAQLKEAERQKELQRQALLRQKQFAEAQKKQPSFAAEVVKDTVVGLAAVSVAKDALQDDQLREQLQQSLAKFEEAARQNGISTPVVNGFASRVQSPVANTPFQNKSAIDRASTFEQARQKAMFAEIYETYDVKPELEHKIENDLQTAREVVEAVTEKPKDQSNAFRTAEQDFEVARDITDLRVALQHNIANNAVQQGVEQAKAQQLAAEITAAFLAEQAKRDKVIADMRAEQQRQQDEAREISQREAAELASQERDAVGQQIERDRTNLDPTTAKFLEDQHARQHGLATQSDQPPKAPTVDLEGNYVDEQDLEQRNLEITSTPTSVTPDYHRVVAYDADGRATNNHDDISVGAAKTRSLGHAHDRRAAADKDAEPIAPPQSVNTVDRGYGDFDQYGQHPFQRNFGPKDGVN